jgi:hypothetical protein
MLLMNGRDILCGTWSLHCSKLNQAKSHSHDVYVQSLAMKKRKHTILISAHVLNHLFVLI